MELTLIAKNKTSCFIYLHFAECQMWKTSFWNVDFSRIQVWRVTEHTPGMPFGKLFLRLYFNDIKNILNGRYINMASTVNQHNI